ncbi:MAG: response regulator [Candidatus Pacebacteria bacterium]|nr:response regulator [Candidatus Paceibacterota bacterium]
MEETKLKKILLAEDDQFISRAYKDGLERVGFEIIIALEGFTAIEKVKTEKPDIVLLDLMMPEKNGFEVLEEIRAGENSKDTPVIILSNLGQASDVEKGKELGATDYLIKSNFSMKEVIEKVKFHLEKSNNK